jgi:chromatin remodeling complex protein RSC6
MKKVEKMKKKRSGNRKPTGFENPHNIPNKFADFLNVEHGCKMTGPEITKKMWEVLKEKGLISDKDGRVFKVTTEVMNVFKLSKEALKVTKMDKNGFNMFNLQKYIKIALEN